MPRLYENHIVRDWVWTWALRVYFLPTYLPTYLICPNDLSYPTTCVFSCFLMHLLGGSIINYFRYYMFSHVIADAIANTSPIL